MALLILPPFKVVLKLPEIVEVDAEELSLKRLRDVVRGSDLSFPRRRAMALLAASDSPNRHRDFQALLENESEPPEIRFQAAIHLGQIRQPEAEEILIENSRVRDERVLAGVIKALGQIGGKQALNAVLSTGEYARGRVAAETKFAATLISHRLGLEGSAITPADDVGYLAVEGECTRPFHVMRADYAEAELCLRSLGYRPFQIELSEDAYELRCGRRVWMLLFNRQFTGHGVVTKLQERIAFPAIVALKSATGLYSAAFLVLTAPAESAQTINITVYRSTGERIFGGPARIDENQVRFSIHAVARPGAFALQLAGILSESGLEIQTALSGLFVQEKRHPIRESTPSESRRHLDH